MEGTYTAQTGSLHDPGDQTSYRYSNSERSKVTNKIHHRQNLKVVTMKVAAFLKVTPCSFCRVSQRTCYLPLPKLRYLWTKIHGATSLTRVSPTIQHHAHVHSHVCSINMVRLLRDHTTAVSTGFRPRRPRFAPKCGRVGFVADKVTLGRDFSEYFSFLCQISSKQLLHIH